MNRLQVGIFGETNAGKSSLFNALTNTNIAIVSDESGTTTDAVQKTMELAPFGPITLIDTAGLNDETTLGTKRLEKTTAIINRIDLAIYVIDAARIKLSIDLYNDFAKKLTTVNTPHILAVTKSDVADSIGAKSLPSAAISVSIHESDTIDKLKKLMVQELSQIKTDDGSLIGDLIPPGSTVLLVAPIDSAAPAGRLILPQVNLLRDCLDHGITAHIATVDTLPNAMANLKKIHLVVTDSQVFSAVEKIIPQDMPLTSFSILMARQKGDIEVLLKGINAIQNLTDGDNVLIAEVCTHSRTHEDIGQVKIPAALKKLTGGKNLNITFTQGRDYPIESGNFALIIHCAGCMISRKEKMNRIKAAQDAGIPITNYGLFLAHASQILERSTGILHKVGGK